MIRSVRQLNSATAVEICGRMDASTAAEIKAELQRLIASGHSRLVLNLRDLEFIDSAGLGVLVGCLRRCVAIGGDLWLAEVPALVLSVLELTRLTRVFQVAASESDADQLMSQGAAQ